MVMVGIEKSGQIWAIPHFALAAGGGERCKEDWVDPPWHYWVRWGSLKGEQVEDVKDLVFGCLTLATPICLSMWAIWLENSGVQGRWFRLEIKTWGSSAEGCYLSEAIG